MNRIVWALLAMAVLLGAGEAGAKSSATPNPNPAPAPASSFHIPSGPALSVLIRRTILSLNDANLSGNYTVFRDLAAPGFQTANDAAKLAAIFTTLRQRKIDLAPIIYFDPKLVREPQIDANGMLHVSGFIPTAPEQVNFDLLFQHVAGSWRMFGIAVDTSPASATAASAAAPKAKPAPPSKPGK